MDIIVEVHFDPKCSEQVKEVKKTGLKVYCIPNESSIVFKDNIMNTYRDIYLCNNNEVLIYKMQNKYM